MNVRHILFLLTGTLLLGSCSDKNLAQVEQDDMYFSRKDRKELYALNNVPTDDVLIATADEQVQQEMTASPEQQTYYDASQNPDYVPGYYAAPTDGGGYDTQSDGQYYVEGYNQAQVQSQQPATNNYYFYGSSPYSSYSPWYQPAVSVSLGFGFGYSPYYSSFYNPYNRYYDPWYYSSYYNPWNYPSYGYGINYAYCPYPSNYYGSSYSSYTVVNNYDDGNFRYADGRYVVNSPRRSRSSVSDSRFVPTGTTTGRRTSTGVVRSESNGRLASVSSRNTYRKYTDTNSGNITTASGRSSRNVNAISLNDPNTTNKSNRQVIQSTNTQNRVVYTKSGDYKGYVKQGTRPTVASAPERDWSAQSKNNSRTRNNIFNRNSSNSSSLNSGNRTNTRTSNNNRSSSNNRSMFNSKSSNRSGSSSQRSSGINRSSNRSSSSFSRSSSSGSSRSRSSSSFSGGSRSSSSGVSGGRSSSGRSSSSSRSSSGGGKSSSSSSRRGN